MAANRPGPGRASRPRGGKKRIPAPPPPAAGRPWGLIAATTAVVLFAAVVIGYGVYRVRDAGTRTPEAKAAAAATIQGVVKKDYPGRDHRQESVPYEQRPPFGGPHDPQWADCTGTVYDGPIRDENAVHSLEHGAIWIAYRPNLPADQVDVLRRLVEGTDYRMLSPYPGLKDAVSVQSWGYQLKLPSASDPRLGEFLGKLTQNAASTPEYGATCANPRFKANPVPPAGGGSSTPTQPATGG